MSRPRFAAIDCSAVSTDQPSCTMPPAASAMASGSSSPGYRTFLPTNAPRTLGPAAMAAGPNVRGALVGRNVLYPGDEDPLAMALAAGGIVHEGWSVETALQSMAANRGRDMDRLSRWL